MPSTVQKANLPFVQGCKYLIQNNISAVFTKLVNEGKTTIRLKEPEHDLCIKG